MGFWGHCVFVLWTVIVVVAIGLLSGVSLSYVFKGLSYG